MLNLEKLFCHDAFLGFSQHTRAYYYPSVALKPGATEEITLGVYSESGGTYGEFCVVWQDFGNEQAAQLQVYEDAWQLFEKLSPLLLPALSKIDGQATTPEQFTQMLKELGFTDVTKTVPDWEES